MEVSLRYSSVLRRSVWCGMLLWLGCGLVAAPLTVRPDDVPPRVPQPDSSGAVSDAESRTPVIQAGVSMTNDLFVGGLLPRAFHLHLLVADADVDLGQLLGWAGARAFVSGMFAFGESPSEVVGDVQAISNIDAPGVRRLYEAFVDQRVFDDRFSVLLGLYDLNSEFYVTETAGFFLNGAHGIGAEFGLSGANGPSIFPYTALALRLDYQGRAGTYVRAALLDGAPCGAETKRVVPIRLRHHEGALLVAEMGRRRDAADGAAAFLLGAWTYTASAARLPEASERPATEPAFGAYAAAERTLVRTTWRPDRRVDGYLRIGYAHAWPNPVMFSWAGALVGTGLVPGRPQDQIGLGVTSARFGHTHLAAQRREGEALQAAETAFELAYRTVVGRRLVLQPNVQYVRYPRGSTSDALLFGTRIVFSF